MALVRAQRRKALMPGYNPETGEGFRIWPAAANRGEYGPNPKQRLLFLDKMSREEKLELQAKGFRVFQEDGNPWGNNLAHLHHRDIVLCVGGAGSGKCLGFDTPVLMYDGTIKPVQDVQVGELVMGPDSLPRRVTSLARGKEQMYRIVPNKGNAFVCNESHILSLMGSGVRLRKHKGKEIHQSGQIRNISVTDYLALSPREKKAWKSYRPDGIDFPARANLPLDAYLLGLWLGDGHAYSQGITTIDPEIKAYLQFVADSHGKVLTVTEQKRKSGGCESLSVSNGNTGGKDNFFLSGLRDLDLLCNKHIPKQYKTAQRQERLDLLAGLLDSDGWLNPAGYFEITQKSKQLADDIAFVARSLGFTAHMKCEKKSCTYKGEKREGTYYRATICGRIEDIPTKIARKQCPPLKHKNNHLVSGITVEKLGVGDYYGFTLDGPDRRFLLGDFTVTHNTVAVVARCSDTMRRYPGSKVLVASTNMPFLKTTVLGDWEAIWTPDDAEKFDHPDVRTPFRENDVTMILQNDSKCTFLSLEKKREKYVRSRKGAIIHLEEASTLVGGSNALDEFIPRLRDNNCPFGQLIATTNPEEEFGYLTTRFNLKQFEEGYTGDPMPIGDPCECQWCDVCIKQEQVEWVDGVCPRCNAKKLDDCPGNQYFQRVIFFYPEDNPHLPTSLASTTKGSMDKDKHATLVRGKIMEIRAGKIYENMHNQLILPKEKDLNPDLDIHWTLDFNQRPQCSAICQIYGMHKKKEAQVLVNKEIVLPGKKSAKSVVRQFVFLLRELMPNWNRTVWIYGDANGYQDETDDGIKHNYHIIAEYLTENKINFQIMAKRMNPSITKRWDSVEDMLKQGRLFFNPSVLWTIESFRTTKYAANGLKEDETMDNHYKRRVKEFTLCGLTHPAVAVGYLITEEFPIVENTPDIPYVLTADGRMLEVRDGNIVEIEDPMTEFSADDDIDLDDEIPSQGGTFNPAGLGSTFRSLGAWG